MNELNKSKEAFFQVLVAAAWVDGTPADRALELLLTYAELLALGSASDARLAAKLKQPPAGSEGLLSLSEQLSALASVEEQALLVAAVEGVVLADGKLTAKKLGFLNDLWALCEPRRDPRQLTAALQRSWNTRAAATARPSRRLRLEPGSIVQGLLISEILGRPPSTAKDQS